MEREKTDRLDLFQSKRSNDPDFSIRTSKHDQPTYIKGISSAQRMCIPTNFGMVNICTMQKEVVKTFPSGKTIITKSKCNIYELVDSSDQCVIAAEVFNEVNMSDGLINFQTIVQRKKRFDDDELRGHDYCDYIHLEMYNKEKCAETSKQVYTYNASMVVVNIDNQLLFAQVMTATKACQLAVRERKSDPLPPSRSQWNRSHDTENRNDDTLSMSTGGAEESNSDSLSIEEGNNTVDELQEESGVTEISTNSTCATRHTPDIILFQQEVEETPDSDRWNTTTFHTRETDLKQQMELLDEGYTSENSLPLDNDTTSIDIYPFPPPPYKWQSNGQPAERGTFVLQKRSHDGSDVLREPTAKRRPYNEQISKSGTQCNSDCIPSTTPPGTESGKTSVVALREDLARAKGPHTQGRQELSPSDCNQSSTSPHPQQGTSTVHSPPESAVPPPVIRYSQPAAEVFARKRCRDGSDVIRESTAKRRSDERATKRIKLLDCVQISKAGTHCSSDRIPTTPPSTKSGKTSVVTSRHIGRAKGTRTRGRQTLPHPWPVQQETFTVHSPPENAMQLNPHASRFDTGGCMAEFLRPQIIPPLTNNPTSLQIPNCCFPHTPGETETKPLSSIFMSLDLGDTRLLSQAENASTSCRMPNCELQWIRIRHEQKAHKKRHSMKTPWKKVIKAKQQHALPAAANPVIRYSQPAAEVFARKRSRDGSDVIEKPAAKRRPYNEQISKSGTHCSSDRIPTTPPSTKSGKTSVVTSRHIGRAKGTRTRGRQTLPHPWPVQQETFTVHSPPENAMQLNPHASRFDTGGCMAEFLRPQIIPPLTNNPTSLQIPNCCFPHTPGETETKPLSSIFMSLDLGDTRLLSQAENASTSCRMPNCELQWIRIRHEQKAHKKRHSMKTPWKKVIKAKQQHALPAAANPVIRYSQPAAEVFARKRSRDGSDVIEKPAAKRRPYNEQISKSGTHCSSDRIPTTPPSTKSGKTSVVTSRHIGRAKGTRTRGRQTLPHPWPVQQETFTVHSPPENAMQLNPHASRFDIGGCMAEFIRPQIIPTLTNNPTSLQIPNCCFPHTPLPGETETKPLSSIFMSLDLGDTRLLSQAENASTSCRMPNCELQWIRIRHEQKAHKKRHSMKTPWKKVIKAKRQHALPAAANPVIRYSQPAAEVFARKRSRDGSDVIEKPTAKRRPYNEQISKSDTHCNSDYIPSTTPPSIESGRTSVVALRQDLARSKGPHTQCRQELSDCNQSSTSPHPQQGTSTVHSPPENAVPRSTIPSPNKFNGNVATIILSVFPTTSDILTLEKTQCHVGTKTDQQAQELVSESLSCHQLPRPLCPDISRDIVSPDDWVLIQALVIERTGPNFAPMFQVPVAQPSQWRTMVTVVIHQQDFEQAMFIQMKQPTCLFIRQLYQMLLCCNGSTSVEMNLMIADLLLCEVIHSQQTTTADGHCTVTRIKVPSPNQFNGNTATVVSSPTYVFPTTSDETQWHFGTKTDEQEMALEPHSHHQLLMSTKDVSHDLNPPRNMAFAVRLLHDSAEGTHTRHLSDTFPQLEPSGISTEHPLAPQESVTPMETDHPMEGPQVPPPPGQSSSEAVMEEIAARKNRIDPTSTSNPDCCLPILPGTNLSDGDAQSTEECNNNELQVDEDSSTADMATNDVSHGLNPPRNVPLAPRFSPDELHQELLLEHSIPSRHPEILHDSAEGTHTRHLSDTFPQLEPSGISTEHPLAPQESVTPIETDHPMEGPQVPPPPGQSCSEVVMEGIAARKNHNNPTSTSNLDSILRPMSEEVERKPPSCSQSRHLDTGTGRCTAVTGKECHAGNGTIGEPAAKNFDKVITPCSSNGAPNNVVPIDNLDRPSYSDVPSDSAASCCCPSESTVASASDLQPPSDNNPCKGTSDIANEKSFTPAIQHNSAEGTHNGTFPQLEPSGISTEQSLPPQVNITSMETNQHPPPGQASGKAVMEEIAARKNHNDPTSPNPDCCPPTLPGEVETNLSGEDSQSTKENNDNELEDFSAADMATNDVSHYFNPPTLAAQLSPDELHQELLVEYTSHSGPTHHPETLHDNAEGSHTRQSDTFPPLEPSGTSTECSLPPQENTAPMETNQPHCPMLLGPQVPPPPGHASGEAVMEEIAARKNYNDPTTTCNPDCCSLKSPREVNTKLSGLLRSSRLFVTRHPSEPENTTTSCRMPQGLKVKGKAQKLILCIERLCTQGVKVAKRFYSGATEAFQRLGGAKGSTLLRISEVTIPCSSGGAPTTAPPYAESGKVTTVVLREGLGRTRLSFNDVPDISVHYLTNPVEIPERSGVRQQRGDRSTPQQSTKNHCTVGQVSDDTGSDESPSHGSESNRDSSSENSSSESKTCESSTNSGRNAYSPSGSGGGDDGDDRKDDGDDRKDDGGDRKDDGGDDRKDDKKKKPYRKKRKKHGKNRKRLRKWNPSRKRKRNRNKTVCSDQPPVLQMKEKNSSDTPLDACSDSDSPPLLPVDSHKDAWERRKRTKKKENAAFSTAERQQRASWKLRKRRSNDHSMPEHHVRRRNPDSTSSNSSQGIQQREPWKWRKRKKQKPWNPSRKRKRNRNKTVCSDQPPVLQKKEKNSSDTPLDACSDSDSPPLLPVDSHKDAWERRKRTKKKENAAFSTAERQQRASWKLRKRRSNDHSMPEHHVRRRNPDSTSSNSSQGIQQREPWKWRKRKKQKPWKPSRKQKRNRNNPKKQKRRCLSQILLKEYSTDAYSNEPASGYVGEDESDSEIEDTTHSKWSSSPHAEKEIRDKLSSVGRDPSGVLQEEGCMHGRPPEPVEEGWANQGDPSGVLLQLQEEGCIHGRPPEPVEESWANQGDPSGVLLQLQEEGWIPGRPPEPVEEHFSSWESDSECEEPLFKPFIQFCGEAETVNDAPTWQEEEGDVSLFCDQDAGTCAECTQETAETTTCAAAIVAQGVVVPLVRIITPHLHGSFVYQPPNLTTCSSFLTAPFASATVSVVVPSAQVYCHHLPSNVNNAPRHSVMESHPMNETNSAIYLSALVFTVIHTVASSPNVLDLESPTSSGSSYSVDSFHTDEPDISSADSEGTVSYVDDSEGTVDCTVSVPRQVVHGLERWPPSCAMPPAVVLGSQVYPHPVQQSNLISSCAMPPAVVLGSQVYPHPVQQSNHISSCAMPPALVPCSQVYPHPVQQSNLISSCAMPPAVVLGSQVYPHPVQQSNHISSCAMPPALVPCSQIYVHPPNNDSNNVPQTAVESSTDAPRELVLSSAPLPPSQHEECGSPTSSCSTDSFHTAEGAVSSLDYTDDSESSKDLVGSLQPDPTEVFTMSPVIQLFFEACGVAVLSNSSIIEEEEERESDTEESGTEESSELSVSSSDPDLPSRWHQPNPFFYPYD